MEKEYFKSYYQNNKEKYNNKKIHCQYCFKEISKNMLSYHQTTAKCQLAKIENLTKINNNQS